MSRRLILIGMAVRLLGSCVPSFGSSCEALVAGASPEVWKALSAPSVNGAEVMNALGAADPEVKALLDQPAGTFEGHTVRQHTLMVFGLLRDWYPVYHKRFGLSAPAGIRVFELLKVTTALHDIGKPLAVKAGDKKRQHEFTIPILEAQLRKQGFNEAELRLAKALAGNDLFGEFLSGEVPLSDFQKRLQSLADAAGLSLREYLPLQTLFYTCDAGSYPRLRDRVFDMNEGFMQPRHPAVKELLRAIAR